MGFGAICRRVARQLAGECADVLGDAWCLPVSGEPTVQRQRLAATTSAYSSAPPNWDAGEPFWC